MALRPVVSALRLGTRELPRPLALHAVWLIDGQPATHRLALWAEAPPHVGARQPRRLASGARRHPASARVEDLEETLPRLWRIARPGVKPRSAADHVAVELWLPTTADAPLLSPTATRLPRADQEATQAPADVPTAAAPSTFDRWRVDALTLDAESATTLLAGLPPSANAELPIPSGESRAASAPLFAGDDLRFWSVAARFALALILRQRYLPGALQLPADEFANGYARGPRVAAFWWAVLSQAGDRDRFEALAEAMPDLCRARVPSLVVPGDNGEPFSPRVVLEDFIHTAVNGYMRHAVTHDYLWLRLPGPELTRRFSYGSYGYLYGDGHSPGYASSGGSLAARWLEGLGTPGRALEVTAAEGRTLLEQTRRWQAGLTGLGTATFRLCFRPLPPCEPEDAQVEDSLAAAGDAGGPPAPPESPALPDVISLPAAGSVESEIGASASDTSDHETVAPDLPWRLAYFMQAADDPSLLVPVADIWRERGATARFLDRRFDAPYERVITGLGEAARLFEPIQRSLRTARPSGCDLTPAEAYGFLHDALPTLTAAGFGVQVPPWWRKAAAARPTARLTLRGGQQLASGLLGLDAIVEYDWRVALGGVELTPEELERLAELKEPLVRLRGRWVEVRPDQIEAIWRFRQRHGGKMSLREALQTALGGGLEDPDLAIDEVRTEEWIGELLGRLRGGQALAEVEPPAGLRGTLRPYQRRGLSWLSFLSRYGLGACLADDMGLGKTVQLLSLVLYQKERGELTHPVLLVCPTSVVGNWRCEAERFTPDLRVLIHHGAGRTARANRDAFAAEAAAHDLVVTTYSLLPRDLETLAGVTWGAVVLDEAQNIKNPTAKQSRAARKLHAPVRIALTGTPVENRLAELWSILDFLNPGYLGSHKRFTENFGSAVEQRRDPAATARLQGLVRPFILRRLKTDPAVIADLPQKIEMVEHCTLTREQVTLYEATVRDGLRQIEGADEPMKRRGVILAMLTRLKQVCNHPAHLLADGSALAGRSGKLIRLEELVEELLAEGDRALIFTQFTAFGERLQPYLMERFGVETLYLHGGVPRAARERMVERFQAGDGPPLFLLSLKAGGTGLNLTAANHVIHYDRWWNPAVENQATDRAFRIGQHRNVQVRKLVCAGTLEERIDTLIERKRGLAEAVVGSGEGWLTELSTAELRDLFTLRRDALAE